MKLRPLALLALCAGLACSTPALAERVQFDPAFNTVQGAVAPGAAGSTENPVLAGAVDGAGLVRAALSDASGAQVVNLEGQKATYTNVFGGLSVTASGQILILQGSGTKKIKITRVTVSASAATAGTFLAGVFRGTAITGGTSTGSSGTAKMDSTSATATGVVTTYTAGATLTGALGFNQAIGMAGSATVLPVATVFDFADRAAKAPTLSGTGEFFGVFFSGGGTTPSVSVAIEWTEE